MDAPTNRAVDLRIARRPAFCALIAAVVVAGCGSAHQRSSTGSRASGTRTSVASAVITLARASRHASPLGIPRTIRTASSCPRRRRRE